MAATSSKSKSQDKIAELKKQVARYRRLEKKLQQSEETFAKVFHSSPCGMVITHLADGRCFDMNESFSRITGFDIVDSIGRSSLEVGFWSGKRERNKVVKELKAHGRYHNFELQFTHRSGEKRIGLFSSEIIKIKNRKCIVTTVRDVTEQRQAEADLRKLHRSLEAKFRKRTKELQRKNKELEEVNAAMNKFLKYRDEERAKIQQKILTNVKELIEPYLEKLEGGVADTHTPFLSVLKTYLDEIISPFTHTMSSQFLGLTPMEIQVANLVKQGKPSKEIARLLDISPRTVGYHRLSLRKKLGLKTKKANLRAYLMSIQ